MIKTEIVKMALTKAKEIYRNAWNEYFSMEENLSKERRKELQRLMDDMQNHFTEEEFDAFKVTLVGYVNWWGTRFKRGRALLRKLKEINNQKGKRK